MVVCLVVTHLLGLDEFKLHATSGPGDEVGVGWVVQQSHKELPELQGASALVRRTLAVKARLLLYVTYKTHAFIKKAIFYKTLLLFVRPLRIQNS